VDTVAPRPSPVHACVRTERDRTNIDRAVRVFDKENVTERRYETTGRTDGQAVNVSPDGNGPPEPGNWFVDDRGVPSGESVILESFILAHKQSPAFVGLDAAGPPGRRPSAGE